MISHAVRVHWTIFTERTGGHWQRWCLTNSLPWKVVGRIGWRQQESRDKKNESISIRLSEILTNELHKYLYPSLYFLYVFNYQFTITIWICLTEIYKVTIACFKPTISVGSTLTHVRFITWTTQCTCWLVVRSCDKVCELLPSTKFLAPLPGIVWVWTTDGSSCFSD